MSAELPNDVRAFVAEVETRANDPKYNATSYASLACVDVLALCALVRSRQELLEAAARFAYDAILASSCCDEPCSCIDCQMLEKLGEALGVPRIGEA